MLLLTFAAGGDESVGVAVFPDWQKTPIREGTLGAALAVSRRPPNYNTKNRKQDEYTMLPIRKCFCLTRLGIIFVSFVSATEGASDGHRYTIEL